MLEVEAQSPKIGGPVVSARGVARVSPSAVPWFYGFKRAFWTSVVRRLISASAPLPLRLPQEEDLTRLELVPVSVLAAAMSDAQNVMTTRGVPREERSLAKVVLLKLSAFLATPLNLRTPGLPRIRTGVLLDDLDAATAQNLGDCYPPSWDAILAPSPGSRDLPRLPPAVPDALRAHPEDIVGALALAGPFASIIQAVPDVPDRFVLDLTALNSYAPKAGYEPVGGKATLVWSSEDGRMFTESLQLADGRLVPKPEPADVALLDPEWRRAQDIFLASLSTYMTAVIHLIASHLKGSGEPAAAAWHALPAAHPLRIFLHPFIHETLSTNNYKVPQLINGEVSLLPALFAFGEQTLHRIVDEVSAAFDIAHYDPRVDAARRGMSSFSGPYPYMKDATALWDLYQDYARKVLDHVYATDADLEADEAVAAWIALWTKMSPSVADYVPDLQKATLARLLATVIFIATTVHENVGKVTWNYTVLHAFIPSRVPLNAARDTIQTQQEYMNLTLATFLPQARLMDPDLVDVAADATCKALAQGFLDSLEARQAAMEAEDGDSYPRPHRLYPVALQRAVNA